MTTYVVFREVPAPKRRTKIWLVETLRGATLGYISWYARWRQYTFHPEHGSTFSAGCLHDIEAFIEREMISRKLVRVA